jgi:hypothetical protein
MTISVPYIYIYIYRVVTPSRSSTNFLGYIIKEASATYLFYVIFWNFHQLFTDVTADFKIIPRMDYNIRDMQELQ